jgi:O-antigen/teichoic acid export membrane protein
MDTLTPIGGRLARTTARAVAWNYLSWFLSKVLVLATTAVLARLLTPDEFGVVGFATVAIAYLAVLRDLGLGGALIQRRTDVEDAADTVFSINLGLGAVLTAATALLAPWVAGYFDEPRITTLLRVLGLTFLIQSLGTTHLVRLQRDLAFRRKLLPDVGQAAVRMVVSIAAAAAGWGIWALVAGQIAGVTASTMLAWVALPWRPRLRLSRRLVAPLARFGAPLLGVDVIHTVVGNLDYLIVGKVLGASALGLYTLAYRLPELLLLGVVTVLSRVFFPALASIQDDPARLRTGFLASIRYVQMVVVPVGLGLLVAADPIVRVILGSEWLEVVPVVRVLAVFALLSSSMVADGDVYKAMGKPQVLARIAVFKLALLVPALLVGVHHGLVGVALAHLVTTAIVKSLRGFVVARMLEIRPAELGRQFLPTLAAGAVMVAAVLPVLGLTTTQSPAARLLLAVSTGAVSYLTTLVVLEGASLRALLELFRPGRTDKAGSRNAEEWR